MLDVFQNHKGIDCWFIPWGKNWLLIHTIGEKQGTKVIFPWTELFCIDKRVNPMNYFYFAWESKRKWFSTVSCFSFLQCNRFPIQTHLYAVKFQNLSKIPQKTWCLKVWEKTLCFSQTKFFQWWLAQTPFESWCW